LQPRSAGITDHERFVVSAAPAEPAREPVPVPPVVSTGRNGYGCIAELLEPIDRAYSKIDEGMEQLNEALDRLTETVRQMRPSEEMSGGDRAAGEAR
jgi:hypothetical protein